MVFRLQFFGGNGVGESCCNGLPVEFISSMKTWQTGTMKVQFRKPRLRGLLMLAALAPLAWCLPNQTATAEGLNPEHVPADAKWLIHIDLDQLLDTELVQTVRDRQPGIVQGVRQWIEREYGIDPRSDLRSVTMFSKDYKEYTGSVVLQAKYDPQKVKEQLKGAEKLETTQWNDLTLYTFQVAKHHGMKNQSGAASSGDQHREASKQADSHDHSGGKEMTVVMLDSDTIVFGSSVENTKSVVGLLQGDQPSLKDKDSKLLTSDATDAMMYGAAIKLANITSNDIPMPVLKQHETITWLFDERDGTLFEHATIVGRSDDVAEKMEKLLQGVVAYEQLWSADSKPLKDIVDAVEVSRDGAIVEVKWESNTETVVAGLDDIMQRFGEWKKMSDN